MSSFVSNEPRGTRLPKTTGFGLSAAGARQVVMVDGRIGREAFAAVGIAIGGVRADAEFRMKPGLVAVAGEKAVREMERVNQLQRACLIPLNAITPDDRMRDAVGDERAVLEHIAPVGTGIGTGDQAPAAFVAAEKAVLDEKPVPRAGAGYGDGRPVARRLRTRLVPDQPAVAKDAAGRRLRRDGRPGAVLRQGRVRLDDAVRDGRGLAEEKPLSPAPPVAAVAPEDAPRDGTTAKARAGAARIPVVVLAVYHVALDQAVAHGNGVVRLPSDARPKQGAAQPPDDVARDGTA